MVLVMVAVVAGAALLVLRQQRTVTGWQNPLLGIAHEELAPDLLLAPLTGASEVATIDTASTLGELETAYAALVFSLELTDARRIGRLLTLGERLVAAQQPERAARCFEQVFDLAVLSPQLNDPLRADALLAAGRGWAAVESREQAIAAFDQVRLLAVESPFLQVAQRRDLLSLLEAEYAALEEAEKAEACREVKTELDNGRRFPQTSRTTDAPELHQAEVAISSPEVGRLEEERRQAAFDLLQMVPAGGSPDADQVEPLRQALLAEDAAKLALYAQELESSPQPGYRIDVLRHQIRWLLFKYRVASLGVGVSVVPEWESRAAEILSELARAYEGLQFDYEDLITALPDASAIAPSMYAVHREIVLAGRLGHYPSFPVEQEAARLRDDVTALIAEGFREQLYVDAQISEAGLSFFLNSSSEYGREVSE
jgi:tetratricopeptide (TPR) repeat protein